MGESIYKSSDSDLYPEYIKNAYNSVIKRRANFKRSIGSEETSSLLPAVACSLRFTKLYNPFPTDGQDRLETSGTQVPTAGLRRGSGKPRLLLVSLSLSLSLIFEEIQLQDSGEADAMDGWIERGTQSPGSQ